MASTVRSTEHNPRNGGVHPRRAGQLAEVMLEKIPQLLPRKLIAGPQVTVVMPTYRRAGQIGESIRSLLNGTFTDFELLVRDDGNETDGTSQAVTEAAGRDARVRYHRNREPL